MELTHLLRGRMVHAAGRRSPAEVAVLEDQHDLAELACEICARLGLSAEQFQTSAAYQAAFNGRRPRLVILDWRLEREVAAAVFMALRHRFADLPIVVWTASGEHALPPIVRADPHTRLVPKTAGLELLESAIREAVPTVPTAEGDGT